MNFVLFVLMQGAIHAIPFEDYQSCINASKQMTYASKTVCIQR